MHAARIKRSKTTLAFEAPQDPRSRETYTTYSFHANKIIRTYRATAAASLQRRSGCQVKRRLAIISFIDLHGTFAVGGTPSTK